MSKSKSQLKSNLNYIPDNETSVKSWLKKHAWGLFAVILAVLGIALSVASINYAIERQYILDNGVSTTGTISTIYTKVEGGWNSRHMGPDLVEYKTISFSDSTAGNKYSFDIKTKSGADDTVGKTQPVTYLKDDPSRAVATNEAQFQDVAFWFTIPIFALGVFVLLWLPKKLMSK